MERKKKALLFAFFSSFFLMLLVSPIHAIVWLFPFSLFFLFEKNYFYAFLVYNNFFLIWYFFICGCFAEHHDYLIISSEFFNSLVMTEDSYNLLSYVVEKYVTLGKTNSFMDAILLNFCIQSIYVFSFFSNCLGEPIYVPILGQGFFKVLYSFTRFVKNLLKDIL